MKKLLSILILCLGCFGFLEAQDIWKPINGTGILGAGPDGSIFAYGEYGALLRSQDEGETWQIVLGQETGFSGSVNHSCFAVSPEERVFVFNDNSQTVVYSDDNGDTWHQTTSFSPYCAFPTKTGLYAVTNDIFVVWAQDGEFQYTLDGGETWNGCVIEFVAELTENKSVTDLIVSENGDVYASISYSFRSNSIGIYHSTFSDINNWELVAFEGISVKDMAFDPEGNVVACGYNADGSSIGFQHVPGFYLFDGTSLAISDGGIVYRPHFVGNQAVLSYSTDHGEHFTEIGEHVPLVDIAPDGDAYFLIKGHDNHLYFDGGGEYWKCIRDADEIITDSPTPYQPIVEDGKQWNVLFSYPWSPPEPQHKYTDIYKIEGDTLVDGVSYKVMYTTRNENLTGWSVCGVIRETEDRQVLYRRDGSAYDEILYDFSMEVGDTIIMNGSGFYPDWMFVVETNEILINGEPRKQIVLEYSWGDQEVWIEGIGSLYGIIDSGSLFLTGGSTDLLCYYEDGDLVWQNTTPGYDECYIVNTGQQGSFVVAPSTLTFEEQGVPQTFTIYNQTDEAVTISSINVQPDDNMVLLSYGELPRTLQPNETMNVEVEVNGVGNKGYNIYRVNVATSIGYRQVTVRVKDDISLYYPLVHEGNDRQKWNVVYILANDNYPNDYHTEIQSIRDNINLDGVDYKLVWTESVYDSKRIAGAVREEDRKVYYRRKLSQSYEEEVLLYDFNLTVGDTVTVNWFGQPLMVIEESEVEVDGTMRRKLVFGPDEYWIEGVGSTFGFLNSGSEGMGGAFIYLLCYHENGNLVWDNEAFDECVMNSDGAPATFAPQEAEWYFHVLSQGPITQPPFYYLKSVVTGTEEVQGHLCSVIDGYRYVYEEDDVVYMYVQSTDSFTVMYDFNAEEGDTWYCDIEEGFTCLVTVDSVGSVTWNGHTYRTQYVTGYIPDEGFLIYDGRIIEGIGYEKGLFPHEYVFDGTEYEYMRCYLEDGELLYHEGDYACDYEPNSGNACWDGTVAEAYEGGDGTAENPYQIKTSEQLALLAQQTNDGTGGNAYYEMTANVNLKDCLTGGGRPWVSIGTREHPFTGHFNGGGKSIMNLFQNFNDSDTQSIGGLFGYASNATLENVNVSNSTIEGVNFAGLIVGWAVNTTIMGCSVDGFISYSSNASCANGGVVGKVEVDYSTHIYIRNCINNATIQANIAGSSGGNVYYFGGIVGQAYVDDIWSNGNLYIVDCCNNGDLMGRGTIGGIAGDHEGIVENCDNFGQISSSGTSGGIVGYTEGMIKNCHNHSNGSVTGNCTGGIVGYSLGGWTLSCVNNAPVIGQFKHSSPSASNKAGGIIGYGDHIFNCYNTGDVAFTLGDNMDEDAIYVGGIGGNIDECKNSYNIGAVASSELQYARCGIIAGCFYDTKNVYWHGDYDLPVYGIGEDPAGSCAFRSGATATSWVLDEAQYGTVDLVEALNAGASEIESQYSRIGPLSRWGYDVEGVNDGFPVLVPNDPEDDELEAYCEAPFNFGGSPISNQGNYGTQLWWNKPFASHWFHYDEKPYAGSVYCNTWGIKIPAEEIHAGDVLTYVAFYMDGGQNQTISYVFAFGFDGETEPDSWDYLPGNSVQIEPNTDGWVMVKLGSPVICEEGKCLWIVLSAPNVDGNNASYCQASGNPNACWSSEGSVAGDWMIRGYFTNDVGYNEVGYNDELDHFNIYRGRTLEELEKIAEVNRDEEEYFDTLQNPFGDYYYQLTAAYTDGRESVPAKRGENPHDKDYVYFHVGNISSLGSEWYYEIENVDGNITYQHLEYDADTTVNDKEVKIIIRTNTLYDKMEHSEVTREYIYEDFGKVYWWNTELQDFTLLYDLGAQIGDEWVIRVGTESLTMHVDSVEQYEYEGTTYRMLRVSDADDLFSGVIMSGIGHLSSFFPERLMTRGKGYRVEGIRCYWREGQLVFKYGDKDCDEVYEQIHFNVEESVETQFKIYPNPTDGVLFVETRRVTSLPAETYRITNLVGQTVLTGSLTAETQQIDVSVLPQGMYFITFAGETRKFVLQ